MRIILIGEGGMLNHAWVRLLQAQGLEFINLGIPQLDLVSPDTILPGLGKNPGLVVNCAAFTDVDGAETHFTLANAVNGTGVGALANACGQLGVPLIHYSTDYVFDGAATKPYPVNGPRNPIGAYGRTKALGEELIESSGCQYLIIRTSWLYAPWGKNFVRTMATLGKQKPLLKVVDDQRGRPTSAQQLALNSLHLFNAGERGLRHLTDDGECSWFEFAAEIIRLTHGGAKVEPCTSAQFPRPAKRPAYSVLDLSDSLRVLGGIPHWKTSLAKVVDEINREYPLQT
jgi:dTDP-4-dehydrorhamnose reductase